MPRKPTGVKTAMGLPQIPELNGVVSPLPQKIFH